MNNLLSQVEQYWQMVVLNSKGQVNLIMLPMARDFIQSLCFSQSMAEVDLDRWLQDQLLILIQNSLAEQTPQKKALAELCLRCRISHQIRRVCTHLIRRFDLANRVEVCELYRFVLDDRGELHATYRSTAQKILKKYGPGVGMGLLAWTNLLIQRNKEINHFLIEQGIYRISDWAILNDTSLGHLEQILHRFYGQSQAEIEDAKILLSRYHVVYRSLRLQRLTVPRKTTLCPPPTISQLQQIDPTLTPNGVLMQLRSLATQVRQYRIAARGGPMPQRVIEICTIEQHLEQEAGESDTEQQQFLEAFRARFEQALDRAIAQTLEAWVQRLGQRHPTKALLFMQVLTLFYGEGLSMAAIATQLPSLKSPSNVSRLLNLKSLRLEISQVWLVQMQAGLKQLAAPYLILERRPDMTPEARAAVEEQLDKFLVQLIQGEVERDRADLSNPRRGVRGQISQETLLAVRMRHALGMRQSTVFRFG